VRWSPEQIVGRASIEERRSPFAPLADRVRTITSDNGGEFASLSSREDDLERTLLAMESAPRHIQSLTGFDWVINGGLNASWHQA
jgi:hypothetical protein